ncbi:class I SAM-dependent methyltransferase [[Kitasatospora] papulosa]|uniref:class I SAM-dependent methyltransferase n=1 Tax=Streptomyces TaxID=1883 RepID=UPI000A4B2516|nr:MULTISPECIES: class I SAM-dependent methyltransferase [Streptomyces]RAS29103.1 ubiquinone/menaquinone biosynthesis C-methylase UbiE [Streptomyces avidinii]TPN17783.1 class I SAM-dependent methyltransferase [Mesorhizobium sp. B2-3-3]SNX78502.1 Ubiquinone/menaquinone biosynthesis C-methylase UbiE [Streptomyces microflavus]WKV77072.1 class I SAM-dependent methyltransferase [Streptomyces sp. SNU607]WSI16481.1 class I SAM-dependent methyltransferase [[Kitasatospora] papulosa]
MKAAEAWNGSLGRHWAAHADRYDAMLAPFDAALFDAAAIGVLDRVLDIGCGTGGTSRAAARLAARGRVTGVDVSEPLVARARALSAHLRDGAVTFEVGDAQAHPFEPGGFDVAISRGGVMFFADPVAAFTHIGEALRPGGRLAFVCPRPAPPGGGEREALTRLASLVGGDQAVDTSVAAAMASLSDPERTGVILEAAGFEGVSVRPVSAATRWGADAADAADFFLSRKQGPPVTDGIRAAAADVFRPYETPEGVLLEAGTWVVTARRPY